MRNPKDWDMFAAHYGARLGNVAIITFIVIQAADGALTYLALQRFGTGAEGNPILTQWMLWVGEEVTLVGAKLTAIALGIVLHLAQAHWAVVSLAFFYAGFALWPWGTILFF